MVIIDTGKRKPIRSIIRATIGKNKVNNNALCN